MEQTDYLAFKETLDTYRFKDIEKQKALCLALRDKAKQNNDDFARFIACIYLLDYAVAVHDYKACKTYMFEAISCKSEESKEELSQFYQLCGIYTFLIGNNHTAIDYDCKTIHICEEINQDARLAAIYNNIALIFYRCEDYPYALTYYRKAYDLMNAKGVVFRKRNISIILGNLVSCYAWLQDVEHARIYYEKSLELGIFEYLNSCLKACIFYLDGHNEEALRYCEETYTLMQNKHVDKHMYYTVYEDLVQLLLRIGDEKQILRGLKCFSQACSQDNVSENIIILRYYIRFAKKFHKVDLLAELYQTYYELKEDDEKEKNAQQAISCADQLMLDKMITLNQYLSTSAIHDSGTGLKNRNAFEHDVNLHMDDTLVTQLSLLMCDVDNFKHHNDAFGHLYGDEILRTLGNFLEELADDDIIPYRYGGDEFLCLAINKDKDAVETYIKQLYACLLNHDEIKISVGFTSMARKDIKDYTDLIMRADKALYRAKANGKNHYEYYE